MSDTSDTTLLKLSDALTNAGALDLVVPALHTTPVERSEDGTIRLSRHPLTSGTCRAADFLTTGYLHWTSAIRQQRRWHRKQWEFVFITQALFEAGALTPGKRGLGFGVGLEPLPALFASLGTSVVATDLAADAMHAAGWAESDQWLSSKADLNQLGICPPEEFEERVTAQACDMNAIPDDFAESFDFTWSSCAFEHLGSIQHGIDFLLNQARCLRPGGVGVHTTEYNVYSNDETLEDPVTVIFRRRDIETMRETVEAEGFQVGQIDYSFGDHVLDGYIDLPPYAAAPHLKLQLGRFASTSIGLIVRRPLN